MAVGTLFMLKIHIDWYVLRSDRSLQIIRVSSYGGILIAATLNADDVIPFSQNLIICGHISDFRRPILMKLLDVQEVSTN